MSFPLAVANPDHIQHLELGVENWNTWRADHPDITPDLSGLDLTGADLTDADLTDASLQDVSTEGAILPISMPPVVRQKSG